MEEEEVAEDYSTKTSKINSAMITNMTLNELWKDFFRHFRHGQYLAANSDLDCIWLSVEPKPPSLRVVGVNSETFSNSTS
jgi:hypothetical protein